jgi:hypothetical protein
MYVHVCVSMDIHIDAEEYCLPPDCSVDMPLAERVGEI